MKALIAALVILTGAAGAGEKTAKLTARLNTPVIPLTGGTVYLHLTVETPRVTFDRRQPVNLAVVVDRSGSMGDERKIDFARSALHRMVDQLTHGDLLSIVIYDDVVDVLLPPQRVRNKREIHALIEGIYPRGSTNLGGGLQEGLRQAERHRRKGYVNRVILLSDGLANRGITDPHQLSSIVRSYRPRAISVTTMGVGLDYNENLMVSLAESGGGNYYFIESPSTLASIMRRELDAASSIVCRDAVLELRLTPGVVIRDVVGHAWTGGDRKGTVRLGDLYNEDTRELTVELVVPPGTDQRDIIASTLAFADGLVAAPSPVSNMVSYSAHEEEIDRNRDMEIQGRAEVAVSTRKVDEAMKALDRGDAKAAAAELEDARQTLMQSGAASGSGPASAMVREQISRLEAFRDTVASGDGKRAKKDIQYKNYLQQKNKQ